MTAPLVPADLDLRNMAFMPLDVVRLRDSDIARKESGESFRAAVLLWCAAWHQVPASSLPSDDVSLASYAGFGRDVKGWQKIRQGALHGFVECSDGRLYHSVIAEKALEVGRKREAYRKRTKNATEARWKRYDMRNGEHHGQRYVEPTECDTGISVRETTEANASSFLEESLGLEEPQKEQATGRKRKNKTLLPENFEPDRDFARKLGWSEKRIDEQIQAFCDSARAHNRQYADWQAAWRNWCTSPFQKPVEVASNGHAPADLESQKAIWKMQWEWWLSHTSNRWPFAGPDPDSSGCHIPQELREQWKEKTP